MTGHDAASASSPSAADLDRLVHEPARLAILAVLAVVEKADFVFLRAQTALTLGNLSSHLSKLETAGYIAVEKSFVGKKPRTMLEITSAGRLALDSYREKMQGILNELPR